MDSRGREGRYLRPVPLGPSSLCGQVKARARASGLADGHSTRLRLVGGARRAVTNKDERHSTTVRTFSRLESANWRPKALTGRWDNLNSMP